MAMQKLEPLLSQQVFRGASGVNALVALAVGVLGSLIGSNAGLLGTHRVLATVLLVTSLLATLSGHRYGKDSRTTGLTRHGLIGLGLAGLQYGLVEHMPVMGHIGLGFLIVVVALVLFARSLPQPSIVTVQGVAGVGGSPAGGSSAAGEPAPREDPLA